MTQLKKRRLSISPECNENPQNNNKKRKINNGLSSEAGPSRTRVGRSPVPLSSDSSATLDGDSPTSSDKGKGKAVEKDPVILELEQLRREVAEQNELLEKNKKTTSLLLQALSCHVCLETMCMPYALSCGHMACQTCLVGWFTSPKPDQNNGPEASEIDWYSDESSDDEAEAPNPEAGPAENEVHANGQDNADQNVDGDGNVHPPAPPIPPVLDIVKLLKTCPHCRCVIKKRPIQIYPVKYAIAALVPGAGGEQESRGRTKKNSKDAPEADPWKDIFPPARGHNPENSDDDAPWPGFGGVPAIPHPPPPPPPPPAPAPAPAPGFAPQQFFQNLIPIGNLVFPPILLPPHHPPSPPPPFIDEEDSVRRCGVCLHEIWGGACTNDHCDVVYNCSEESDDGVRILDDGQVLNGDGEDGEAHQDHDDADDGYESSFIDDGDDGQGLLGRLQQRFSQGEGTSSDVEPADDDFIPGPSRRYLSRRQDPIIISSSDDESDIHVPRRAVRRRARQIIDVDEEEEENAEREEEQEVEGDVRSSDQSFSSNNLIAEHQLTQPSAVHYIEEDDEYYGTGEVPYVWDEEDGEADNVVYLPDEEVDAGYES